ncbi:RNA guanine-N7 methyltransferase activating subunit [Anopheles maculipalpis]|uniref:RNA guanine-N7 methyltransferase activating subunit n=1 Tax=Anopheles maculipalpis TaxID=1496333 RepID=UPI002158DEAE|nr:RNA guanine-N7 methyltransferase activating subunit [Anopheles maculipalpis]
MVDPKRHINILSPEEQAFMEECENEFTGRFTDLDEEFMAHCQRESKPPPVVHPWNSRRGGGGGGGGNGPDRGRGRSGGNVGWQSERHFNDRRGGRARYSSYGNNYRRSEYRSARDDIYQNHRNQHSSRTDYRPSPNDHSDDRRYNQEARR